MGLQLCGAVEVADCVLREAARGAADYGEDWRGERGGGLQDAGEFEAGDGGDLVVVAAGETSGCGSAEEGADEAAVGRDSVGELLVGEGGGEQEGWGVVSVVAGRFCGGRVKCPMRGFLHCPFDVLRVRSR